MKSQALSRYSSEKTGRVVEPPPFCQPDLSRSNYKILKTINLNNYFILIV